QSPSFQQNEPSWEDIFNTVEMYVHQEKTNSQINLGYSQLSPPKPTPNPQEKEKEELISTVKEQQRCRSESESEVNHNRNHNFAIRTPTPDHLEKFAKIENYARTYKQTQDSEVKNPSKIEKKLQELILTQQSHDQSWLCGDDMNKVIEKWQKSELQKNTTFWVCSSDAFPFFISTESDETLLKRFKQFGPRNMSSNEVSKELKYLLMPINFPNEHWSLMLLKLKDRQFFYFDSLDWNFFELPGGNKGYRNLLKLASLTSPTKERKSNSEDLQPERNFYPVTVPQQRNSYDCGYLVLTMIEKIIQNSSLVEDLCPTYPKWPLKLWFGCETEAKRMRQVVKEVKGGSGS
ncbi:MAG: Ulp1 family isopeptidase, partial [Bacteroidia bacterium]